MKTIKLSLLMVIMLSVCIGSLFAGGFALSGVGSRATAMGGAFRGLSDDASAMFWNPAGLGFMDENSIGLGGTFIAPTAEWDSKGTIFAYNGNPVQTYPGYADKKYVAEKNLKSFPNLFVTMAKNPKLKYGLGVFVPYGLGTTWNAYELPTNLPTAWGGSPLIYQAGFPKNEMLSSIAILDMHPSVAYQIMPNLSAGMGISVLYGSIDLAKVAFYPDPANPPDPTNPLTYQYKYAPVSSDLSGTGIGYGANFGLMFKPMETLSLGLSGKMPTKVPMKGEAEVYLWKPQSATLPALKLGGKSDIDTDLNLPGDFGLGLSYKVMPNWVVNLDYTYTMWSTLEKVEVTMKDPIVITPTMSVTESIIDFKWEDTSRISLGTEYKMPCGNNLRLGFYYDQTPIPVETQVITLSDIGNKISSNIGWGRSFGKLGVDANFQYVMFTERKVETQGATNMAGTYNSNSMSGNVGLSYRF